jgi:hypothetical protein
MNRRELMTVLGGVTTAWPRSARAQQSGQMQLGGVFDLTTS